MAIVEVQDVPHPACTKTDVLAEQQLDLSVGHRFCSTIRLTCFSYRECWCVC